MIEQDIKTNELRARTPSFFDTHTSQSQWPHTHISSGDRPPRRCAKPTHGLEPDDEEPAETSRGTIASIVT